MKFVIDANVIISGLIGLRGPPGRLLLAAADGRIDLVAPVTVREEVRNRLQSKLRWDATDADDAVDAVPVEWIDQAAYEAVLEEVRPTIRDADDAPLLAVAYVQNAPVVSGDKAFQVLETRLVSALTPRQAWDAVRDSSTIS